MERCIGVCAVIINKSDRHTGSLQSSNHRIHLIIVRMQVLTRDHDVIHFACVVQIYCGLYAGVIVGTRLTAATCAEQQTIRIMRNSIDIIVAPAFADCHNNDIANDNDSHHDN